MGAVGFWVIRANGESYQVKVNHRHAQVCLVLPPEAHAATLRDFMKMKCVIFVGVVISGNIFKDTVSYTHL